MLYGARKLNNQKSFRFLLSHPSIQNIQIQGKFSLCAGVSPPLWSPIQISWPKCFDLFVPLSKRTEPSRPTNAPHPGRYFGLQDAGGVWTVSFVASTYIPLGVRYKKPVALEGGGVAWFHESFGPTRACGHPMMWLRVPLILPEESSDLGTSLLPHECCTHPVVVVFFFKMPKRA